MGRVIHSTLVCLCVLKGAVVYSQTSWTWNLNGSEDWNTASPTKWTPNTSFPNGPDQQAIFGSIITTAATITVGANLTIGSIQFDNVNNYTVTPTATEQIAFQTSTGAPSITVTNLPGAHTLGTVVNISSRNLSITQDSAGIFTMSGIIKEQNGSGSITIGGTQTTAITNPFNSYTGGVTISSGILRISEDVGATSPLGAATGAVTIQSGTFQSGGAFTTRAARPFVLSGAATIDTPGSDTLAIGGVVSGPGSLTKTSGGTLILPSVNTYIGGTTINGGILSVFADTGLGNASGGLTIGTASTFQATDSFNSARTISLAGAGTVDVAAGKTLGLSGAISGAGSLTKTSAGTLILTGTNSYTGGTTVSAGTLQGNTNSLVGNIANNGTLIFNQTFGGTYAGSLTGAGPLTIQGGGQLIMTGDSSGFTGNTTLTSSTQLIVNGALGGGTLTIGAGSLVRGTGAIPTTVNNGRLFPGNSVGTLTVNGNLTFNGGSSLFSEIAPLQGSLVAVTGTASLTGGAFTLIPTPGFYGLEQNYTLLTSAGLGGTTFASVSSTNPNVAPKLTYTLTDVLLRVSILRPFLDFPFANKNERAVGMNLDDLATSGQLSSDLISVINTFIGQSVATIDDALDQMHPAAMSALAELHVENGGQMLSLFHRKPTLICGCSSPNRAWIQPFGNWLKEKQQGEEIGFHATTRGLAFGYDRELYDCWTVGGGGVWSSTDLTWSLDRGHAYTTGLYLAGYTDLSLGSWYFGSSIYGGVDWYDTARGIHFTTIDRQAKAEYHGIDIGSQITAAYYFGIPSCLFYPYGTIDYLYLNNESYTENGADSLDLNVRSYTSSTIRSEAGLALQIIDKNYQETICISPLVSMGWVMNWPVHRDQYTANFSGMAIPFSVWGWDETWQMLNFHFGLGIRYKCFSLDSEYILDISPDGGGPLLNQRANFNLNYNF